MIPVVSGCQGSVFPCVFCMLRNSAIDTVELTEGIQLRLVTDIWVENGEQPLCVLRSLTLAQEEGRVQL